MELNFNSVIILENSRVHLSPMKQEHLKVLWTVLKKDPDLLKYSPSNVSSINQLEAYIHDALSDKRNKKRYPFIIYDKLKKEYVGSTSYGNVSNFDQRLEIGWTWIGKEFQRTGLNRHCKYLLLEYAFETLEFERVEFKTDCRNEQSKTAIQSIGAQFEGELRKHSVMSDGFRRNTCYYSILKNEWENIKETIFENLV